MPPNSKKKSRTGSGAPGASPFLLEKQIPQDELWGWVVSTLIGLVVLTVFWLLIPREPVRIPALERLVIVSVGAGGFYLGIRFLAYWATWVTQARRRKPTAGLQPGAHGELPRNAFILVLSAPGISSALMLGAIALWGLGSAPEFGLAVSVVAGISVPDLRAIHHLLPINSEYWIKQTSGGLDVLKLIDRT